MLKTVLGVDIYQDSMPESASLPAASFANISKTTDKVLSGNVDLRRSNWSVKIAVDTSRLDCDVLCNKLRALDGGRYSGFQLINVISDSDEPRPDPNIQIYTTNIDLELIPLSSSVM